jgi:hypothetical protein
MSIEFFAYSLDATPVAVSSLSERCRRHAIELRVLRQFADWSKFQVVQDGAIESGDLICGWNPSAPTASAVARAVAQCDATALHAHEAGGRLAAFAIEVWTDPAAYNGDLDDEAEGYQDGYADARAASAVRFYARVAAGRGDLSATLPETVLLRILEMRGGLFDDPQECEFRLIAPKG